MLLIYFVMHAVVSELIHLTAAGSSGGVAVQMPLIQVIVPQVMSLKSQLRDPSKVINHFAFKLLPSAAG